MLSHPPPPSTSTLGALIRARRREVGLTLAQLAEQAGCAKSYLSLIENENRAADQGGGGGGGGGAAGNGTNGHAGGGGGGGGGGAIALGSRPSLGIARDGAGKAGSPDLIARLEAALALAPGTLRKAAQWQATPAPIRREFQALADARAAAGAQLRELIRSARGLHGGEGGLDAMFRTGALRTLIETLGGDVDGVAKGESAAARSHSDIVPVAYPFAGEDQLGKRGRALGDEAQSEEGDAHAQLPFHIPLINSVAAGYPTEFTDLGYPARIADQYVPAPPMAPGAVQDPDAFAARVVGDSMMPDYREGDIVVFSPARPIRDGADCFVRFEGRGETTFKRIFFEPPLPSPLPLAAPDPHHYQVPSHHQRIRLQPLNPRYPSRSFPREEIAGLYAAASVMRTL